MKKLIILLVVVAGVAAVELVPVHSASAFFGEGRRFRGGEEGLRRGPIVQYRGFGEGWRGYGYGSSPYYGGSYYYSPRVYSPGFNYGYNPGYGFGGYRSYGYYPSYGYGWGGGYCE